MPQAHYRDHGKFHFARSVLVLHNVAHQGEPPPCVAAVAVAGLRLLFVEGKLLHTSGPAAASWIACALCVSLSISSTHAASL